MVLGGNWARIIAGHGCSGPNGAGKTTALGVLLGLVQPTQGSAAINGRPYQQLPNPSHHVGAALEAAEVHPGRTARNHPAGARPGRGGPATGHRRRRADRAGGRPAVDPRVRSRARPRRLGSGVLQLAAATLGGADSTASTPPIPPDLKPLAPAAVVALLAGLAVLLGTVAARTTVHRDITRTQAPAGTRPRMRA